MNKLISFLLARAGAVFAVTLALCALLAAFATGVKIEAKATSFFLENDPDLQEFFKNEKLFGEQNYYLLAAATLEQEPFSPAWLEHLKRLDSKLAAVPGIKGALSVLNARLFLSGAESLQAGADLKLAKQEISANEIYVKNLISEDLRTVNFLLDASEALDMSALRELAAQNGLVLGGMSVIVDRMKAYIKSDLAIYGSALFVLLAAAVWWFFGRAYYVFVCVFICALVLLASTGIFVLLGYAITVISSNFIPLVLIITISVIIHLLAHFAELSGRPSERRLIVRHTLLAKSKPSFFAILTTVVGFLSLVFSGIVPISELGAMMSIGICLALILCYLLMPFLLLKAPSGRQKALSLRLLSFASSCAIAHRGKIYTISAALLVVAAFALPRLEAENSFANYFKQNSLIKRSLVLLDSKLGGTLPLEVVLDFSESAAAAGEIPAPSENPVFSQNPAPATVEPAPSENPVFSQNPAPNESGFDEFAEFDAELEQKQPFLTAQKIEQLRAVHKKIEAMQHVGSVLSLASLADFAAKINPQAGDTVGLNLLLNVLDERSKEQIVKPYLNEQKQLLRLSVRMKDSDPNLRRGEFLARLRAELPELVSARVQISGVMVLYNNMLSSLVHSQVDTLAFVVGSIFALFLLIFRNLRFSLIGLIANLVPLSALFSIIAFGGLRLDLMSITIAAISIGIGVDDIIHYVHRFREEIKRRPLEDAIKATHLSIGSALFYTTTTVVLGFMLMMSSSFIPTIYFGLLTVLVMVLLLSGSLFLLPALIISWHGRGYFKAEFTKEKNKI